jgi:hypothetical protein
MYMWCEPEDSDNDSHGWESRDGGQTWQDAGDTASTELGPPIIINISQGCPKCGMPLSKSQ